MKKEGLMITNRDKAIIQKIVPSVDMHKALQFLKSVMNPKGFTAVNYLDNGQCGWKERADISEHDIYTLVKMFLRADDSDKIGHWTHGLGPDETPYLLHDNEKEMSLEIVFNENSGYGSNGNITSILIINVFLGEPSNYPSYEHCVSILEELRSEPYYEPNCNEIDFYSLALQELGTKQEEFENRIKTNISETVSKFLESPHIIDNLTMEELNNTLILMDRKL